MDALTAAAAGAPPALVLGLLVWSLKRNVRANDAQVAEAKRAVREARQEAAGIVAAVREEIIASGAETRRAVDNLSGNVKELAGAIGLHGERLARGDEKLASLERRVDGLEGRERERDRVR